MSLNSIDLGKKRVSPPQKNKKKKELIKIFSTLTEEHQSLDSWKQKSYKNGVKFNNIKPDFKAYKVTLRCKNRSQERPN